MIRSPFPTLTDGTASSLGRNSDGMKVSGGSRNLDAPEKTPFLGFHPVPYRSATHCMFMRAVTHSLYVKIVPTA